MANPFEFAQQVRREVAKVTWPTRRETMVTTVMVVILSIIAAIFFLLADQVISWVVGLLINAGR
ncbi:MAG: preprotein translocase subunit SecE [Rhizobiales bacterium]|nr:preprotein translocase subunit SecE [Hyphomicrobiales bacterium]